MKRIINLLLLIMSTMILSVSCQKHEDPTPQEEEFINMPISVKHSSVSINDEPLTRATGNLVYAISISQLNSNTGNYESYAFGFFDSMSGVSVKLNKKKKYIIQAAVLYDFFSQGLAFCSSKNGDDVFYTSSNNEFVYIEGTSFFYGISNWRLTKTGYTTQVVPCDVYYNFINDFDPSKSSSCSLELNRISSGINIEVEGLTEGSLQVQVASNDNRSHKLTFELSPEITSVSDIFCYDRFLSENTSKMYIQADYYYPSSESTIVYQEVVSFTRNMRKRLRFVLESESSQETNASFGINLNNASMNDEDIKTIKGTI